MDDARAPRQEPPVELGQLISPPHYSAVRHGPVRLVALDLDGTLLNAERGISPRTQRAIYQAVNRGVHVVLASARPPRSVRYYYQALRLQTVQINYNGALIWDEKQRRVVAHRPLPLEVARKVIAFARRRHRDVLVSVEILDKWYTDHIADIPEYATETSRHFVPDFIGPLSSFLTVPVTKVMLLGEPQWIAALEEKLPQRFGSAITHTRSDPHLLQIMAPGVSKGAALYHVAQQLGVPLEEAMAVGDAPNDLEMFAAVGLPVAMGNAWPEIRRVAKCIVPPNTADGVAVAIERFVLPKQDRA